MGQWIENKIYIKVAEELAAEGLPPTCRCQRSNPNACYGRCTFCVTYDKWEEYYEDQKEEDME